jgi:hypothetical protein
MNKHPQLATCTTRSFSGTIIHAINVTGFGALYATTGGAIASDYTTYLCPRKAKHSDVHDTLLQALMLAVEHQQRTAHTINVVLAI